MGKFSVFRVLFFRKVLIMEVTYENVQAFFSEFLEKLSAKAENSDEFPRDPRNYLFESRSKHGLNLGV